MDVEIGMLVRLYYDSDTFDEGEVKAMTEDGIDVDFYDWIERWPSAAQFSPGNSYFEADKQFLVPNIAGEIITDFRIALSRW
jgi:hypothetical protein